MPLELIWSDVLPPVTDAVVSLKRKPFFSPGPGFIRSHGKKPCQFTVYVPRENTPRDKWEVFLANTYLEIMCRAKESGCATVLMPFLSESTTDIPRDQDYQIAAGILIPYAAEHNMTVFLQQQRTDFLIDFGIHLELLLHLNASDVPFHAPQPHPDTCKDLLGPPIFPPAPAPSRRELHPKKSDVTLDPQLRSELDAELAKFNTQTCESDDASFTDRLFQMIDERGLTDPQVYTRANISRQHFSKIRSTKDYKPTKPTAVALAIALELSLQDTENLLERAGHFLLDQTKFDIIVKYFITHRREIRKKQPEPDFLSLINSVLREYEQPLLGSMKRDA